MATHGNLAPLSDLVLRMANTLLTLTPGSCLIPGEGPGLDGASCIMRNSRTITCHGLNDTQTLQNTVRKKQQLGLGFGKPASMCFVPALCSPFPNTSMESGYEPGSKEQVGVPDMGSLGAASPPRTHRGLCSRQSLTSSRCQPRHPHVRSRPGHPLGTGKVKTEMVPRAVRTAVPGRQWLRQCLISSEVRGQSQRLPWPLSGLRGLCGPIFLRSC